MDKKQAFSLKLIFPCRFEEFDHYGFPAGWFIPYGMGILTAFLREQGYFVEQEDLSVKFNSYFYPSPRIPIGSGMNLNLSKNKNELDAFLKSDATKGRLVTFIDSILDSSRIKDFNLIGLSIFSYHHFLFALALAKRIKQRFTTPIVFGGPFIRSYGNLYHREFDFIDYMIIGDGSIPLLKLIHYLEGKSTISEVPNLSYRNNGDVAANQHEEYPIEDMPMPDFSDLPLKLYNVNLFKESGLLAYQITRGCSSRCSFCSYHLANKRLEFKSYDKVVTELNQMKERYHIRRFIFCGEAINNSREYQEGLCDVFIKNRLRIHWHAHVKTSPMDKYILRKMKKAGCISLSFGVESGSNRILQMMGKGYTVEQAGKALRWSYEAGIRNRVCLIVGYPHETQADINQTLAFINKNKKYIIHFSVYKFTLIYGSDLYYNYAKHGIANLFPTPQKFVFTFDESSGLGWAEKKKQQANSREQIIKTIRAAKSFLYVYINFKMRLWSSINLMYRLLYFNR